MLNQVENLCCIEISKKLGSPCVKNIEQGRVRGHLSTHVFFPIDQLLFRLMGVIIGSNNFPLWYKIYQNVSKC